MEIPFAEISSTGNRYKLDTLSIADDEERFELSGPVSFRCTLKRKSDARVFLSGIIIGKLQLRCDRCLTRYPYLVQSEFQLILQVPTSECWRVKEVEKPVSDLDCVELLKPIVDLDEVARQQLYVELPEKMICSESCKGLCPGCGNNLNQQDCACIADEDANPFAILAGLKKK